MKRASVTPEAAELTLTPPGPPPLPEKFPLVLVVEYDLNLCSPNRNAYAGGPDAAKATLAAARALIGRKAALCQRVRRVYDAAGAPEWDLPVVVDVVVRRGDRVDEDNLRAALKSAADALFKSQREQYVKRGDKREKLITPQRSITPDDRPAWVEWGEVSQKIDRRLRGEESFSLTIWPREIIARRERCGESVISAARLGVESGDWEPLKHAVSEGLLCGLYPREVTR